MARSTVVGGAIGSWSMVVSTEIVIVLRSVVWNYGIARNVCRWEG